ncbi:MAG: ROK family protein [Mycobacterium leprae]
MPAGPELIRAINKQRVLQLIRSAGPLSRADAAEQTKLTRPTISAVVTELLDEGWVEEMGTGESSGGRPPILLRFNPRARWVIGAELGAGHVRAVLSDLSGEVVYRVKHRVESSSAVREVGRLESAVRELLEALSLRPDRAPVAGIGVGITGVVDRNAGIWRYSPHFDVADMPVASLLQDRLGLPVLVENDARTMAWGERSFGAARGVDNLAYIRIGVGIGAGIIIDGVPYGGANRGAGELGHMLIQENGPLCRCGQKGCLEAVASAIAISNRSIDRIRQGERSLVAELVDGDFSKVLGSTVIEAAKKGDAVARDTLWESGRFIGTAIGNLVNLLNPSMVVIGGGLSRAGELIMTPIREAALSRALPALRSRVSILPTQIGEDSCPVGGTALVIEELFRSPEIAG